MSSTKIVQVTKEGDYIGYSHVLLDEYEFSDGERLFSHSYIVDMLRKIMGRTLTLVEASHSDKEQRKAMKDLVKQIINDELSFSSEWGFDQEVLQSLIDEQADTLKAVDIEEVLNS